MALFDAFTGAPAMQAADQTRNYLGGIQQQGLGNIATGAAQATNYLPQYGNLSRGALTGAFDPALGAIQGGNEMSLAALYGGQNQARADIAGGAGLATGALGAGYNTGLGAINQGYANAGGNLAGGFNTARGDVNAGAGAAIGQINAGTNAATGYLNQGRGAYDPLAAIGQKYGAGGSLYLDALGVNGAGGQANARSAFQAGPAYTYNLDQGLEAINRRRNAGGMLASGNADRDAQVFGAGLASNEYDKWLAGLQSTINPELAATGSAASGRAGIDVNAANLQSQAGQSRAQIEGNRGSMLSDLASRYGTQQAGLDVGQGGAVSGLASNYAQNLANNYTNTGNQLGNVAMSGGNAIANTINQGATGQAGLYTGLGSGLASSYAGEGAGLANTATNAGNLQAQMLAQLAPLYGQTFGQEAAAQQQGSANLWGALGNAAKLGLTPIGGGGFTYQPNPNGGGLSPVAQGPAPTLLSNLWGQFNG